MRIIYENGPLKVRQYPDGRIALQLKGEWGSNVVKMTVEQSMKMTAKISSAVFPFQKRGG